MSHRTGLPRGILLLAVLCAVSFGAIVRVALAGDNHHVSCVDHGFYSGASNNDSSFYARIAAGCSSSNRYCGVLDNGSQFGHEQVYDTTSICNAWSRSFSSIVNECTAGAHLIDAAAFA